MPVGNNATAAIPFGSLRRGSSEWSKPYLRSNRQSMKRKRKPMKSCDDWRVLING